jgi:hypothetical protein
MAEVTVTAPAPTVTSVTVSPSAISVAKGGTQAFSANITGEGNPSQAVTWSVTGGVTGTSISPAGLLTVASAESAATLTVTATSVVDTTKSGTATVTVTGSEPGVPDATVTSVSVSPATPSVERGGTQAFTATVQGTNNPARTVTWTVSGGASGTSISDTGFQTVAATESAETLTVTATSTADTSKSGKATVTLTGEVVPHGSLDITIGLPIYGEITITGTASDGTITVSKSGADGAPTSVTLNASDGYTGVVWYIDGDPAGTTADSITIYAVYHTGRHTVTFTGYSGGIPYSKVIPFTVIE